MKDGFFAVVNPAAGGGKCGRLADKALDELHEAGLKLEIVESREPGDGARLTREAYRDGFRKFLAVGGDGTSYEIVNGLFPEALSGERPALGFLPLGTGNSFLRDFTDRSVAHARDAIIAGRRQPCDVLRLTHGSGDLYFINLLSMGFAADVAFLRQRAFKGLGEFGYLLAIFVGLARLRRRAFPLRVDGEAQSDQARCLFLSFNNSKFTGGKMMIAPLANTSDGLVEYVRWGPIGRLGLIHNLGTLYDGSHIHHPMASRRGARTIEFDFAAPVDVMIDGEVLTLDCKRLDVLPAALDVMA